MFVVVFTFSIYFSYLKRKFKKKLPLLRKSSKLDLEEVLILSTSKRENKSFGFKWEKKK